MWQNSHVHAHVVDNDCLYLADTNTRGSSSLSKNIFQTIYNTTMTSEK